MNICFIANFYKTYFFHEIAKNLESNGVDVHWIVVNSKLRDFLLNHYPPERVLYISKSNAEASGKPIGDFRLNEIIYGDRVLKNEPEWAIEYLRNIQLPFSNFIQNHEIRYVFGEITWAHEILFHRILRALPELGAKYLNPHTIRIPNGRFAFFKDEYQSEFQEIENPQQVSDTDAEFLVEKPDYLAINDSKIKKSRGLRERLNRVRRFISRENIDPKDPTVTSNRWLSFKKHASEEFNREIYRFVKRTPYSSELGRKPYVFLALHKQPEASIDVIGRYYEDQWINILNIWRSLPDNWQLLVKEHSNAIGDRPYSFYSKINKLHNTYLIDEKADSHALIFHSEAVVTVSGTVAYEAALLQKRSITFAPCFFNKFQHCENITIGKIIKGGIFQAAQAKGSDSAAKEFILNNSFPGVISDPISMPSIISQNNIRLVTTAFLKILK